MKTSGKWITCGTSALFAAALSIQAQTSTPKSQPSTSTADTTQANSTSSAGANAGASASTERQPSSSSSLASQPSSSAANSPTGSSTAGTGSQAATGSSSTSGSRREISQPSSNSSGSVSTPGSTTNAASGSFSGSASGSLSATRSGTTQTQPGISTSTTTTSPSVSTSGSQAGIAGSQSTTTQNTLTASTQSETQVTTFVQQLDAQGPVVVERVTTQFADVTCSPDNARMLVEALRGGTAVTLSADGKTTTFTPSAKLGYGEAYIALALAAEALRNAGVSGCATPEQWKAVLMGGPLVASSTTTTATTRSASSSSSSHSPGILALRAQGQGWGQIAQTTNVQLGRVVSNAQSSFKLEDKESKLTPTGRTSAEVNQGRKQDDDKPGKSEGAPYGKAYGHDKDGNDRSENGAEASRPNR